MRSGKQEPRGPLVARGVTGPGEGTGTAENSQRVGRPCPWPELPGLGGDAGSPPTSLLSVSTQPSAPPGRERLLPHPALESSSFGPETADTRAAVTWPARGLLVMALLQVCTGAAAEVSSQAQGSHVAPQAHR